MKTRIPALAIVFIGKAVAWAAILIWIIISHYDGPVPHILP
jgi:hypothetical protein